MSTAHDTRRRLMDQGRAAFAAKGHDGVSLQRDVLEPSGVSTGSFYHQFSDKTALLVAILEDASEQGRYLLSTIPTEPEITEARDDARRALTFLFDLLDGADDLLRIAIREAQSPHEPVRELLRQIRASWVELIALRIGSRFPDGAPFDVELAAQLVNAMCLGIVVHYIDLPEPERPAARTQLIDGMAAFATSGLLGLATTS